MAAAPNNKKTEETGRVSEEVQRFAVRAATGGTTPGEGDEKPEYRLTSIRRSAGGQRLDVAEFEYATTEVLQDIKTPVSYREIIDVVAVREVDKEGDDEPPDDIVFRGEMGLPRLGLDENGQQNVTATARIEPWHFGEPVRGWRAMLVVSSENVYRTIHEDIVFNPRIDKRVLPNKADWFIDVDTAVGSKWYVWLDPESVRSDNAETSIGQTASLWTLKEAVYTLCYWLNGSETYIKNPDYKALNDTLGGAPDLKDWTIRRGHYLPQALDEILTPHGYSWYVKHSVDKDGDYQRQIVVFARGRGTEKTVKLAASGDDRSLETSSVATVEATWNIAEGANIVEAYGSFPEVEGTFELRKSWAAAKDALTAQELAKDGDDSKYEANPDVWRKWVLNEAGDYTATRTGNTLFNLNTVEVTVGGDKAFGDQNIYRRRRFSPPLTKAPDGGRRDYLVEYLAPAETYGDLDEWRNVLTLPDAHFSVLTRECGIMFTGQRPPEEIVRIGSNARIRITACLTGDQRLSATATKTDVSPNGADIRLILNAETRYHKRTRIEDTGATHCSRYADENLYTDGIIPEADTANDATALESFAIRTRNLEQAARLAPVVTLQGYHPEFEIGDIITEVEGRGLSFNQNAEDNATKKYPQVMEIEYTQDRTKLTLKTFEDLAEGA